MGLYKEKRYAIWIAVPAVTAIAAAFYLPWIFSGPDLFRMEGLYAVEATEFSFRNLMVTAHQVGLKNGFPLYPALIAWVCKSTGYPMEVVMRSISVLMLFMTAGLVFIGSKSTRSSHAGIVAASIYLTSLVSLEKGWEGNPVTLNAFFLLAAQLCFFYYGARANWNRAWIVASLFLAAGFLSGGFRLLLFFFFPLFFLRRPFSVQSKFHHVGFVVGMALLAATVFVWALPYAEAYNRIPLDYQFWGNTPGEDFLRNLWEFPAKIPVRLCPWSLIIWLPFCAALQALDTTPIYNRYLRTLVAPIALILWLVPEYDSREMLYWLGPLAILCGNAYELGMRRYGTRLRKILVLAEYVPFIILLLMMAMLLLPEAWLESFASIDNSLDFRTAPGFFKVEILCYLLTVVIGIALHCARRREPVSLMLLLVSASIAVFFSGILLHYHAQNREKSHFGADIAAALQNQPAGTLYKGNISDLYGGLFYSGAKVVKLASLDLLPQDEEVVYVIGSTFPMFGDRSWHNLFPPDYQYHGHPLGLWKGVRTEEDADGETFLLKPTDQPREKSNE